VTVPIIIQARFSSSRLPGKVLMPWGDTTLLGHVIDECQRTGLEVWVATSDQPEDAAVAYEGLAHGSKVYRGSLDDVLGRFVGCVNAMDEEPEAIVRICADRPFLNAAFILAAVRRWNANPWPILRFGEGSLTVEIVRTTALRHADALATELDEREHVTPWLIRMSAHPIEVPSTVDNADDYAFLAPA